MQLSRVVRFCALMAGVLAPALCLTGQIPTVKEPQSKDDIIKEAPVLQPRSGPGEYQAHGDAGSVTVAADYMGHSVPTPEEIYNTEDYVVVEAALFSSSGERLKISPNNFSLRINGKKDLPSLSYLVIVKSTKDPAWEPTASEKKEHETSISSSNNGGRSGSILNNPSAVNSTPTLHIPPEVRHQMELRIQKASLAEGERTLPQAGLLYFSYHGKDKGIQSIELVYAGPTGTTTLALQP